MRKVLIFVFITLLVFVFIGYPGIYYNELTDVFLSIMSQGLLTKGPVIIFNNYGSHFLLGHLYAWLNNMYPANWLGTCLLLAMFLSVLLLVFKLQLYNKNKENASLWMMGAVTGAWIWHDVIFVQSTTLSFYLILLPIWIIWEYPESLRNSSKKKLAIGILATCFLFGLLIRPLSIFLVFLIPLPLVLAHKYFVDREGIRPVLLSGILFFTVSLSMVWLSSQAYNDTDRDYAQFAEFKSSVWDNGQAENSLRLENAQDSVVYNSLASYFIPEKELINSERLKKIGIQQAHDPKKFIAMSVHNLPYKVDKAIEKWGELFTYHSRWYFLIAAVLLLFSYARDRRAFFWQTGIVAWTLFCLFLLAVLIKMEERVLLPVCTATLLLLYRHTAAKPSRKWLSFLLLLITTWSGFAYVKDEYIEAKERRKGQESIEMLQTMIRKEYPDRIVMLDAFAVNILGNRIIPCKPANKSIKWFTADPGYLIFYPGYADRQRSLTGTSGFDELIRYAKTHPDRMVFICLGDRIKLIQQYSAVMYKEEIRFGNPEPVLQAGNILSGRVPYFLYIVLPDLP